jgi:hypothetical protein
VSRKRSVLHIVRQAIGLDKNSRIPVRVDSSDTGPVLRGMPGHYRTRSGLTIVRHPNAYRRSGNFAVYHKSTQVITVGADWLLRMKVVTK